MRYGRRASTIAWLAPWFALTLACDGPPPAPAPRSDAPATKSEPPPASPAPAPPPAPTPDAAAPANDPAPVEPVAKSTSPIVDLEPQTDAPPEPEPKNAKLPWGWRLTSTKWSDGAAVTLPGSAIRSVAACLRTVKPPRAEVVITLAGAKIKKVEVRKASLKCVEELPGIATPGIDRDGDVIAIFTRDP